MIDRLRHLREALQDCYGAIDTVIQGDGDHKVLVKLEEAGRFVGKADDLLFQCIQYLKNVKA